MDQSLTLSTLGIPIAFLILGIIVLWFLIGSKGWWWMKMGVISVVLYFCVALWYSLGSYLGWPSHSELPPKFIVHWVFIDEPSKKTDYPGAIYIWIKELETEKNNPYFSILAYKGDTNDPRIYSLPYSKKLHGRMQQVLQQLRKGAVIIGGKKAKGKGKGKGKGIGIGADEAEKGEGNGSFSFSHSDEFYFHELPPPKIPYKMRNPH